MQSEAKTSAVAIWLLIFCVLIWGSSYILIKRGLLAFSPYQVGALRLTIAALCLLPISIFSLHKKGFAHYPWKQIIFAGICGNLLPSVCYPFAQQKISSATVGVLNAFTPLLTLLIGYLFYKSKIKWWNGIGFLLGLMGTILLVVLQPGNPKQDTEYSYGLAVLFATLCYGINVNYVRYHLTNIVGAVELAALSLLAAGLPASIYLLSTDFFVQMQAADFSSLLNLFSVEGHTRAILMQSDSFAFVCIFLLGALGTALASVLFYQMVNLAGALFAASTTYLMPIVSLAWGIADNEHINWAHFVGMFLILTGVFLVNRK